MVHLPDTAAESARTPPLLLFGATVLTLDAEARVLRDVEVLVDHGRILAIGRAITGAPGTRLVDLTGHVLMPGLVQGHVHLGQTFFRGLAENRQLLAWLRERIWPLEAAHDDESAYASTLLGAAECLLAGTTTIQDIGLGPGARGLLEAIRDARLRALAGKCLMDGGDGLPAALADETEAALASTEALGEEFDGTTGGRLRYVLNPRFVLTCSDELWRGVVELAARRSWPIHTHALEQREETELVRARTGRDEIEYFDETGVLQSDLRIAHGVWLDERHRPRLAGERFSVVHCPSSNLKLASGVADVVGLRRSGIPVGLGCDGAACANHLDAFEELRLAALVQKLKNGAASFSGLDALRLATSEGARAVGLGEEIGTIEPGKRADLVALDLGSPGLWASAATDPHDLVAFSASRAHVRHVFVEGEQLVEDGRLVRLDLEKVKKDADLACRALLKRSGVEL